MAAIGAPRQSRTAALLDRARAALAVARGEPDEARRALAPLLAGTEPDPRLMRERAFARAELGLALQAAGQRDAAQPLLARARADLAALQSRPTPLALAVAHALDAAP